MPNPWRLVLLIISIVLFVLLAILGAEIVTDTPIEATTAWALLGFGLAAFAGAHI
jgi:hypothetical protein